MDIGQRNLVLRVVSAFGFVMAAAVLYLSIKGPSSFPSRAELITQSGPVAWSRSDRYGVEFGLAGDFRSFSYARKSGDLSAIASALTDPAEQPFTVLTLPTLDRGLAGEPFLQVYELRSSKRLLRSHSQIRQSWREDYIFGYVAAALVFLAAAFLWFVARRSRPNSSFNRKPLRGSG